MKTRELNPLANPEAVRDSIVVEIGERDYSFDLQAQLCVDSLRMPVENTSMEWPEQLSPFVKIATIHLPKQDISPAVNLEIADRTSITPWRTRENHIPLGEIMTGGAKCTGVRLNCGGRSIGSRNENLLMRTRCSSYLRYDDCLRHRGSKSRVKQVVQQDQ